MPSSLDEWQTRLEQHFEALAKSRSESGLDIFALEHGLDEDALDEIGPKLRLPLKNNLRLSPHWLLWVVYLTEHGYRYEGDEYWPSFELQTARWDVKKRYQLAQWFKKFERTYRGGLCRPSAGRTASASSRDQSLMQFYRSTFRINLPERSIINATA